MGKWVEDPGALKGLYSGYEISREGWTRLCAFRSKVVRDMFFHSKHCSPTLVLESVLRNKRPLSCSRKLPPDTKRRYLRGRRKGIWGGGQKQGEELAAIDVAASWATHRRLEEAKCSGQTEESNLLKVLQICTREFN